MSQILKTGFLKSCYLLVIFVGYHRFFGVQSVDVDLNIFLKNTTDFRPPDKCIQENYFSYYSTKTYVVGTQKNRLNETVLLSTQNTCLN